MKIKLILTDAAFLNLHFVILFIHLSFQCYDPVVDVILYSNPVSAFQSCRLCLDAGVTFLFARYFAACYEMKQVLLNSLDFIICPLAPCLPSCHKWKQKKNLNANVR